MSLTVKRVERAKEPGRYGDGNGLYLQISKAGVKSWLLRYMRDGRERWMGLGPLHTFNLYEARQRAKAARQKLQDGIDPIEARRGEKTTRRLAEAKKLTFAEGAQKYYEQHSGKWRNRKHSAQFISTLRQYAFPHVGKLPVGDVDTMLVLKVLEQEVAAERGYPAGRFWDARPETASRVRGRIESVLDWATVRQYRSGDNPARWKGHLDNVLPARGAIAKVEHHAALSYKEISEFMAALREREGVAAQALEFTILTAARTGEVVGARWDEVDVANATWTIPAGRMKASREHRVPLSDRAVELLNNLHREDGNLHLFIGSQPGSALSNMAMAMTMRRMGRSETVHGFRSTFRDWAAETTGFPNHVVEMALAHTIGDKVEAAYRRNDLFEKRRKLMDAWSAYCCSLLVKKQNGNVVRIRAPR